MPKLFDVIIPVLNNPQWLAMCLTALKAHTKTPASEWQLIIVDNGCDEPTKRLINAVAVQGLGAKVVYHDNSSFSSSCNLGIAAGDAHNIVLLNSDVIVQDNWDLYMLADMQDPTVGITGARSNAAAGWQGDPNSWKYGMRLPNDLANGREPLCAPFLVFLCVMFSRKLFDKVGPLDPKFGWGGCEDLDYSWRVEKAGYKNVISHAYVLHGCSKTFEIAFDPATRSKNDLAAQEYNKQKHGEEWVAKHHLNRPVLALGLLSRTDSAPLAYTRSLVAALVAMHQHGWNVITIQATRTHTALAREIIAQDALKANADILLFIDDDQTFTADDMLKLIMAQKDVIAGHVYMRIPPFRSCVFKWANEEDKKKYYATAEKPSDIGLQNQEGIEGRGIVEVDAVGFGFVAIKTEVFRKVPQPWFSWTTGKFGEDMSFCLKAKEHGFKVFAHTDLDIGHMMEPQIVNRATRAGWAKAQAGG